MALVTDPTTGFRPGDRALILTQGKLNGSEATVMSVRMRAGRPFCLAVAFDHPGQNGEGKMGCLPFNRTDNSPAASFMQLPRLTLRQTVPLEDGSDSTPRATKSAADLLVEAPPAWGNHLRIPSYTLKTRASPEDEGAQTHATQASGGDGGARQPILPSIFVPGFPKSATTWLYTCISDAFAPHRVGCGEDASRWNASACSRRFLLTAVTAERWLRGEFLVEQKKETFFYGGTRQRFFRSDLLTFVGPDSAKATLRPNDPPLWAWEQRSQRLRRAAAENHLVNPATLPTPKGRVAKEQRREEERVYIEQRARLSQADLQTRLSALCSHSKPPCNNEVSGGGKRGKKKARTQSAQEEAAAAAAVAALEPPLSDCVHKACHRTVRDVPSTHSVSCSWDERLQTWLGRNDTFCVSSMLPYGKPGEYKIRVGDFTPNYLCDADALPRLRRTSPDPDALRFIVMMRNPTSRAFSEWAMFALQWAWDPIGEFGTSFALKARQLQTCNRTLFRNPAALKNLSTDELSRYLKRCWNFGGAMRYATNSLYSVCVLHALRWFRREQFLFLRYEDLMSMEPESLLKLIGRFTGLYAGDDLIEANRGNKRCTPRARKGGRATNTYKTISPEERVLYNASARYIKGDRATLNAFFAPYNAMLAELVGNPDFTW